MIDRLKQVLEERDLSASQFADMVGVQRSRVSHILTGRNKPGLEFIQKILSAFPDIDPGWFILGREQHQGEQEREVVKHDSTERNDIARNEGLFGGHEQNDVSPGVQDQKAFGKTDKQNYMQDDGVRSTGNTAIPKQNKGFSIRKVLILYENGTFEEFKPQSD
jgi:transcriptional regulator with XRE-family HTH domain